MKALIDVVCFAAVERSFQHLAPLNEKHFCPLAERLNGRLKSVFVFRRLRVELTVFLVKISQRYLGAMLFKHLKTVRQLDKTTLHMKIFKPGVAPGIFQWGLTLPTVGLKYGCQGTINDKISENMVFHLPTRD